MTAWRRQSRPVAINRKCLASLQLLASTGTTNAFGVNDTDQIVGQYDDAAWAMRWARSARPGSSTASPAIRRALTTPQHT
jgi:hypothetical protein